MNAYFEEQLAVMRHAVESIDEAALDRLVDTAAGTLRRGGKIVATGIGKNTPICEKFVGTMVSMGLDSTYMNADSAMHGDLGCLKDGDMLLILSKSGETGETVALMQTLLRQERKITPWLITYTENSPLRSLVPNAIVMELLHEGDMWNCLPNNSTLVDLFLLQSIAMLTARRMELPFAQFLRNHPGGAIGAHAAVPAAGGEAGV